MTQIIKVLLLTGLSGAGKTFSLKRLEDIGYEVIDNPPLFTILDILNPEQFLPAKIAIGIDTRTRDFEGESIEHIISHLRNRKDLDFKVVFLDCDDQVLYHRYAESRRPHPLLGNVPIMEAIAQERVLLEPLKKESDDVIDTSGLKAPEFTRLLLHHFGEEKKSKVQVHLTSFGFRYGIPRNAEFLFDVRFLLNPYYETTLRPMNGRDGEIQDYIRLDPVYTLFINHVIETFKILLPRYKQDLRKGLSIGIGCTGGQHRSVFVVEELARFFERENAKTEIYHRDLIHKKEH